MRVSNFQDKRLKNKTKEYQVLTDLLDELLRKKRLCDLQISIWEYDRKKGAQKLKDQVDSDQ
jgi:hypothetical protein